MVEFFYTGAMCKLADAASVLTLSHRYQVHDLSAIAVDRILESLSSKTCVLAIRALRPLRGEPDFRHAWLELCSRAFSDLSVMEKLTLNV